MVQLLRIRNADNFDHFRQHPAKDKDKTTILINLSECIAAAAQISLYNKVKCFKFPSPSGYNWGFPTKSVNQIIKSIIVMQQFFTNFRWPKRTRQRL